MSDAVVVALVTVVAAAIGYVARPLGEWITDRRVTSRESEAQRRQFQIDTLTALQDEMATAVNEALIVGRLAGGSHDHRVRAEVAELRAGALAARVRDDEVRSLVAAFRLTVITRVARQGDSYEETVNAMRRAYDAANDRISVVLRTL